MEVLTLALGNDEKFDEAVHRGLDGKGVLLQAGPITLATRDRATVGGNAGAVIAFDVSLPDGKIVTAQAVVTVKQLLMTLAALHGRYSAGGCAPDGARH